MADFNSTIPNSSLGSSSTMPKSNPNSNMAGLSNII